MTGCYLERCPVTCWVQLGRHGDIMILLPAMKKFFEDTGVKPVMMVCSEFRSTLDCCSYVIPFPVDGFSWFGDVILAKKIADYWYDRVVVPKWWDCPGITPPPPKPDEPTTTLRHQGRVMVVGLEEWSSYQYSQWRATGLSRQNMLDLPLVFDNRSPDREATLASRYMNRKLPVVLYNFSGVSNPMPFEPEIMSELRSLQGRIELVDMRHVRAENVPDMLGMFDRALCSINGDTATLHLAAASNTPHIALLANGGAGSIPKGNCILKLRYGEIRSNVGAVKSTIEKLLWDRAAREGKNP